MSQQHQNMNPPRNEGEGSSFRNSITGNNELNNVPSQPTEHDLQESNFDQLNAGLESFGDNEYSFNIDDSFNLNGEHIDNAYPSDPFDNYDSPRIGENPVQETFGIGVHGTSNGEEHQSYPLEDPGNLDVVGHPRANYMGPVQGGHIMGDGQDISYHNQIPGPLGSDVLGSITSFTGRNVDLVDGRDPQREFPFHFSPHLPAKPPSFENPFDTAYAPVDVPSTTGRAGEGRVRIGRVPSQAVDAARTSRFAHFARSSSDVPGHEYNGFTDLPHILFQLDAGPDNKPDKKQKPYPVIVNGAPRRGPNDRPVNRFDCLPDHISCWVDGCLMEFWWRSDPNIAYDDIIARMDEDEVDEEKAKQNASGSVSKPKAKPRTGKAKAPPRKNNDGGDRKLQGLAWHQKPHGSRFEDKPGKKAFSNALNMRRMHESRQTLGIRTWVHRRDAVTGPEALVVDSLSQEQIDHNTTLAIKDEGLEVVRIEYEAKGDKKTKRRKVPTGEYLPRNYFLGGAQPGDFNFSDRFKKIQKWVTDHNAIAKKKGLNGWTDLQPSDLTKETRKASKHYVDPSKKPSKKKKGGKDAEVEAGEEEEQSDEDADGTIADSEDTSVIEGTKRGASEQDATSSMPPSKRVKTSRKSNAGSSSTTAITRSGTSATVNDGDSQGTGAPGRRTAPPRILPGTSTPTDRTPTPVIGTPVAVTRIPPQPSGGPSRVPFDQINAQLRQYFDQQVLRRLGQLNITPGHPRYRAAFQETMRELVDTEIAQENAAFTAGTGHGMSRWLALTQLRRHI